MGGGGVWTSTSTSMSSLSFRCGGGRPEEIGASGGGETGSSRGGHVSQGGSVGMISSELSSLTRSTLPSNSPKWSPEMRTYLGTGKLCKGGGA